MGFISWLLNKKEEPPVRFPYSYVRVVWTNTAIHDGTFDDYNKRIEIIEDEEVIETKQYTKEDLDAILKVKKIPYYDLTEINAGEPEFNVMETLSGEFSIWKI